VKDFDVPEGGHEGPRKLWGYKPLNEEHLRAQDGKTARELISFLKEKPNPQYRHLIQPARQRAVEILKVLGITDNWDFSNGSM